jgi:heat shock protein HslJ
MIRLILALLVAALGLTACGSEDGGSEASDAPKLDGRTFVALAVTDAGEPHPLADGTELRLSFQDGQLGIHAGCNQLSGDYELSGDRLAVGPIGGTEMGCPEPLLDQDAWLAEVLSGDLRFQLGDDDLLLTAGEVVFELTDRETVSPDRPLEDTEWSLDSLMQGDTVSSVPGGVGATLRVADGKAHVETGCNELTWDVVVDDGTITFSGGVTTDVGCPGDLATVEDAISLVLEGEVTWQVTERTLTITNGDQGLGFRSE